MNLQKNDKIILVVGVVILIAAAGAIAIYTTQSNDDDKNHSDQSEKMMIYDVKWTEKTRTLDSKTYTLSLNGIFLNKGKSASDEDCFTVDQDNVKSIEINVSYTDSKMGLPWLGFLGKGALGIGKDELMVTITDPDEMDINTVIKGNGKKTIEIEGRVRPFSTSIDAESYEEAKMKLEENYSKEWSGETFKLKASLTIKLNERIRLSNRIFERLFKDTFKIDVTYHYYEYSLMENLEEDNTEDTNDEDSETGIGDFYNLMSYGRQMI